MKLCICVCAGKSRIISRLLNSKIKTKSGLAPDINHDVRTKRGILLVVSLQPNKIK